MYISSFSSSIASSFFFSSSSSSSSFLLFLHYLLFFLYLPAPFSFTFSTTSTSFICLLSPLPRLLPSSASFLHFLHRLLLFHVFHSFFSSSSLYIGVPSVGILILAYILVQLWMGRVSRYKIIILDSKYLSVWFLLV